MHAELAQLRILLQLLDGTHDAEIHFARRLLWNGWLVLQTMNSLVDPALERLIDPPARGLKIGGNTLGVPALGVKPNNRQPPLHSIVDLPIEGIAASHAGRRKAPRQDPLHGPRIEAPTGSDIPNRRQLMGTECRMLSLQIGE